MNNNQNIANNGQPINENIPNSLPNVPVTPPIANTNYGQMVNNNAMPINSIEVNPNQSNQNSNITLGPTNNMVNTIPTNNLTYDTPIEPLPTNEPSQNQYINTTEIHSQTMLNDLNVEGSYNKMEAPEYVNDSNVQENIRPQKKNTITITKELKSIITIALVLLVFIIIMPIIFDLINKIRFH